MSTTNTETCPGAGTGHKETAYITALAKVRNVDGQKTLTNQTVSTKHNPIRKGSLMKSTRFYSHLLPSLLKLENSLEEITLQLEDATAPSTAIDNAYEALRHISEVIKTLSTPRPAEPAALTEPVDYVLVLEAAA